MSEEVCPQCKAPAQSHAFCRSCGAGLTQAQDPFVGRTLLNQYITQIILPSGSVSMVSSVYTDTVNACVKAIAKGMRYPPFDEAFGPISLNYNGSVY